MDATNAEIPQDLVQEEALWFPDGTLVLRAETHLFRVFPGILAAKSPVFQDMLSFPQPQNGESYDGCPLVHLPDSAADMTHFLKAIFHYEYFEPWPTKLAFEIVAGVLRMSQKYQVDHLRKRALVHLSRRYPISLNEFGCTYEWEDPIAVANLARHVAADWILPVVLSSCAWLDPAKLLDGSLTPADALLCFRARDQLQTYWSSKVLHFLCTPSRILGCKTPEFCAHLRLEFRSQAEDWCEEHVRVLNLWDEETWDGMEEPCDVCLTSMKSANAAGRQECWNNLPNLFGLPNWQTLLNMRKAALGFLRTSPVSRITAQNIIQRNLAMKL
ncbi:BTB domain-containing protein [Mycena sanguinolenta]|uniref:BTB domain-containing protein n=1 Tax=Mycena sanguinolenta TaxID=230812 RepID=A0A8H6XB19_9AGAR|nr:BTB domain-containing protein [Mycena sanguinolenta]